MKVRVARPQTGMLNGQWWPAVGELVDLPAHVAESMLAAGDVEKVTAQKPAVESRPAATDAVETRAPKKTSKRTAKKAVAKKS